MKWQQVRETLSGKLKGRIEPATKHDNGYVQCGHTPIGRVLLGRHGGIDMKPWEINGCANSLRIGPHDFKELVRCNMSQAQFCEKALRKVQSLLPE